MATEVRASHILVKTEDQIKTLLERLQKGETFEELAEKISLCPSRANGGDLATVETNYGWHLIKVTGKI